MYLFLLTGFAVIIWAVREIRQERCRVMEQEDTSADLRELILELQTAADTAIAEMEAAAAKVQSLIAEYRSLPVARAVTEVSCPEPISLHGERKSRQPGARRKEAKRPGRFQRVIDLAEAGWPDGDIARATGVGRGEVQLILQLRK